MATSPSPLGRASDQDAERLFAVLLSEDHTGRPRFSEEEILTYLPLLMASAGIRLEPSLAAGAVFQRVAQLVGAVAEDSDEELEKKLADYFLAHPPSAALQEAFAVFCRTEAGVVTADGFEGFVSRQARSGPAATPIGISPTHPAYDVIDKPRDPK